MRMLGYTYVLLRYFHFRMKLVVLSMRAWYRFIKALYNQIPPPEIQLEARIEVAIPAEYTGLLKAEARPPDATEEQDGEADRPQKRTKPTNQQNR